MWGFPQNYNILQSSPIFFDPEICRHAGNVKKYWSIPGNIFYAALREQLQLFNVCMHLLVQLQE